MITMNAFEHKYLSNFKIANLKDGSKEIDTGSNKIELPKNIIFHWWVEANFSFSRRGINTIDLNKPYHYFVLGYKNRVGKGSKSSMGKVKQEIQTETKALNNKATKITDLERLRLGNRDLIINYSYMDDTFKFNKSKPNLLSQYISSINTLLWGIGGIDNTDILNRKHFVWVELDDFTLDYISFNRLLDKKYERKPELVDKGIDTNSMYFLRELFKYIDPKYNEYSMLNGLTTNELEKVYFIFSRGDYVSIISISKLFKEIKEFNLDGTGLSFEVVKKLLYWHLATVGVHNNIDIDNLDKVEVDEKHIEDKVEVLIAKNQAKKATEGINTEEVYVNYTPSTITLEDIKKGKTEDDLEKQLEDKKITKQEYKKIKAIIDKSKTIQVTKQVSDKLIPITIPLDTVNKEWAEDKFTAWDKDYITKHLDNDIRNNIAAVSNSNVKVLDYTSKVLPNPVLGDSAEISIKVKDVDNLSKPPRTVKIILPKIKEDGVFTISGNNYRFKKQKVDLPIRKIDSTEVVLSSFYGKVFVTKATKKKDDIGYWYKRQIANAEGITNLVTIGNNYMGSKLPELYIAIGHYANTFTYKGYHFDFTNTKSEIPKVIATKGNNKILLLKDGNIEVEGNTLPLYEYLNLKSNYPKEFVEVKVYNNNVPLFLILSYLYGLLPALDILKVKYVIGDKPKFPYNLDINFNDTKLRIDTTTLGNISNWVYTFRKFTKNFPLAAFNEQDVYYSLITDIKLHKSHLEEIKEADKLFVDYSTSIILTKMHEPTTYRGLLIRAAELLEDRDYKNPNDTKEMMIKGYDRVAGLVYKELVKSIKDYNKKKNYTNAKVTMNPYSVYSTINNDPTTILVDDLNPIAYLKQIEDVTYGGEGLGRKNVSAIYKDFNKGDIGIISEATREGANAGDAVFMSANPAIDNLYGTVPSKVDKNPSNMFSTTAMLMPFLLQDDMKRITFASIQNSHVIPADDYVVPAVCTGYEDMIPYRLPAKYCYHAEQEGKITKVTNSSIEVTYKDKTSKTLSLANWTTKEKGGTTFVIEMVTPLKLGDKVKQYDVITYAPRFFDISIFNKKRISFKFTKEVNVLQVENGYNFEDGCDIYSGTTNELSTTVVKVNTSNLPLDEDILLFKKPGDKVEVNEPLMVIGIDDGDTSIYAAMNRKSYLSDSNGIIEKIVVYYNPGDTTDDEDAIGLKPSFKTLLSKADKKGKVNSSYSVKGKPLDIGRAIVKYYIKANKPLVLQDKLVVSHQLKTTVTNIFDTPKYGDNGEIIDVLFSPTGINARIVESYLPLGMATLILDKAKKKAIEIYRGK